MAEFQVSEVAANLHQSALDCQGLSFVIIETRPLLCDKDFFNNGSHSWTHCLSTVTMVDDGTTQTRARSLLQLSNVTDTVLLNEKKLRVHRSV